MRIVVKDKTKGDRLSRDRNAYKSDRKRDRRNKLARNMLAGAIV